MRGVAFKTLRDGICEDVGRSGVSDTTYLATVTSFINQALDLAYGWLDSGWPELKTVSTETVTSQAIDRDAVGSGYWGAQRILGVTTNHPYTSVNPLPVNYDEVGSSIVIRDSSAASLYVEHIEAPPVFVNTAWATATAYVVGDVRLQTNDAYYCATAHTSGAFATDLAEAKWVVLKIPAFLNLPVRSAVAAALKGTAGQTQTQLTLISEQLNVLLGQMAQRYERRR
jgi:hypothetical protein